ncbi:MAG: GAF domain-containing protein [Deltaproteobacteria bacterium]|nr:GAF domain-containing protein [Deltaproteobacteria bacterium]
MEGLNKRIRELEEEVDRLTADLERAGERAQDLEDTRKAMLFLLEDINESKSYILKAKNEWEATFDAISDPLYIHDGEMRVIRCNSAYRKAAGIPFKEIFGRPYYEVFPKMDGPLCSCAENTASPGEAAEEAEEEVRVPYINKIFKVRVFFQRDEVSGKDYSIHVLEDITEERRAAEKEKTLYNFSIRVMANLDLNYRLRVVCETAVELGYMMAWIGFLRKETREVVPAAHAGADQDYLSSIKIKYDDSPLGMGPTGAAIKNKRPEVQDHLETDRRYEPWRQVTAERGYRSSASFPIIEDGEVIAVLSIYSNEEEFPQRDFDLLSTFANQAASYIKVSWLFVKLKESSEKVREEMELSRHLLTIAEATANTTDIESLMEKAVDRLKSIMGCRICLSYLWDGESGVFTPCSGKGLLPEAVPVFRVETLAPDTPFIKGAIESKGPFLYRHEDRGGPDGHCNGPAAPVWGDVSGPVVVIPLFGKEGTLGVLLCVYKDGGSAYTDGFGERDTEVLTGVSHQISTALEVARLYKDSIDKTMDLSRKVEVIQAMHAIDMSILSIRDQRDILETAARMVGKLMFCDRATIALVDRDRGGFVYAAGYGINSLKKDSFVKFEETTVTEVVVSGRPQYTANLKEVKEVRALERLLIEEGFLSHIRAPLTLRGEVIGVLNVGAKRTAAFNSDDLSTIENLASQISVALDNSRLLSGLKELFIGTVKTLSKAIDAKSPWTSGHSERVTEIAIGIGAEMGLGEDELKDLELAGLLHDIGKLGTYEYILDKPGRLNEEEQKIIRLHPAKGAEILAPIKELKKIAPVIRHHHENYDGTGYPDGLKGEMIPFASRILTVADTVDAMGADRPYRKGRTTDEIVAELKRCSGTQFDPVIVDAYLRMLRVKVA